MRKLLLLAMVIVLLVVVNDTYATDPPQGWLGIEFGSPREKLIAKGTDEYGAFVSDKKVGENEILVFHHGVPISEKFYVEAVCFDYFKNRLFSISAFGMWGQDYKSLLNAITAKYGLFKTEDIQNVYGNTIGIKHTWTIQTVQILLTYNRTKESVSLVYVYIPILADVIKDKKKEAEKDKDSF